MHPSSIDNMKKARGYIESSLRPDMTILDVGGRALHKDKDRSYMPIFSDVAKDYWVADIIDGIGVTHHMKEQYTLPLDDESVDLLVSGQTLEHVKNPFRLVADMKRVLRKNGYMILIAPSAGRRHDAIDCWRFMDDSFKAIAEEVGLAVIEDWVTRSGYPERSSQWADHTFIGKK
jgi:SAM-dependent methyltransferase